MYQRILSNPPVKLHSHVITWIIGILFPPWLSNYHIPLNPLPNTPLNNQAKSKEHTYSNASTLTTLSHDATHQNKKGNCIWLALSATPLTLSETTTLGLRSLPNLIPLPSQKNPTSSPVYPYIDNFTSLVQLVLDGDIPKQHDPSFNCNYFLALYKYPNDYKRVSPLL